MGILLQLNKTLLTNIYFVPLSATSKWANFTSRNVSLLDYVDKGWAIAQINGDYIVRRGKTCTSLNSEEHPKENGLEMMNKHGLQSVQKASNSLSWKCTFLGDVLTIAVIQLGLIT